MTAKMGQVWGSSFPFLVSILVVALVSAMDTVDTSSVHPTLSNVFARMDKDHDGALTRADLQARARGGPQG